MSESGSSWDDETERWLREAEETSTFIGSKGLGDEFLAWALARRAEVDRLLGISETSE